MGRPVSSDLQALLDLADCNTQTTLELRLTDSSEIYLATAALTIGGHDYASDLRHADELKQSMLLPPDRVNVSIQNVDKEIGEPVTEEDLVKAEGIQGRYYRDPAGVLPSVWEELFRGEVRPTNLDENEAKLEMLHDLAAAGFCVGHWTLAENCQFVYKHAGTCGSSGVRDSCNKKRKSKFGCYGDDNELRYGGMEFPDVQPVDAPSGDIEIIGVPPGHPPNSCPRVDQWVPIARAGEVSARLAGDLAQGDWVYNPKSKRFHKVKSAEIVKDQPIWCIQSSAGVAGFSSPSHPVFPYRDHDAFSGIRVSEFSDGDPLLLWRRRSHEMFNHAVSRSFDTGELGDVVRVELEDGHVYAYGDSQEVFIVCHNATKPLQDIGF